jgi:glycosyltransferase involved in cell wall biosynthesis
MRVPSASTEPTVSVIIPTRDRPTLLRAALDSVLAQTRPVTQIVVVDDASEGDHGWNDLVARSPAIELTHCPRRGGAAAARNLGLDRATGDHVVFLDDDDLLAPAFVEHGLARLHADPTVAGVFFRYEVIGGTDVDAAGTARAMPPLVRSNNAVCRTTLEQRPITAFLRYLVPIHSALVRRSAIGPLRFPAMLPQGEDTYFWIALAAAGRRFVLDERPYALVRRHPGNMTRSTLGYVRAIQPCYRRLLADRLLAAPDDVYLAHLKLLWFGMMTGGRGIIPHAFHVAASPNRLADELGFWSANLLSRWTRPHTVEHGA